MAEIDTTLSSNPTTDYMDKVNKSIDFNDQSEVDYREGRKAKAALEADEIEYDRREIVDESETSYVVEEREDGPYIIAQQPKDQPVRHYGESGLRLDELPEAAVEEDVVSRVGKIARSTVEVAEGIPKGIGFGLTKFATNVIRTAVDNPLGDFAVGEENVEKFEEFTKEFLGNAEQVANQSKIFGEEFGDAGQMAVGVGDVTGQFIAPAGGLYKMFRTLGAGAVLASVLADATVGFSGVAPETPNVANLISEDSKTFGMLRDLIATDPESSEFENRAKNAVEAMALLGIGEGIGRGIVSTFTAGRKAIKELEFSPSVAKAFDDNIDKAVATGGAGAALTPGQAQALEDDEETYPGGPTRRELLETWKNHIALDQDGNPEDIQGTLMEMEPEEVQILEEAKEVHINPIVTAAAQRHNFNKLENEHGLPHGLLSAVMWTESRGKPNAVSPAGAKGLFQFMDPTAEQFGIDPMNPAEASKGAAQYLGQLLKMFDGDIDKALAGYNWGQGNVKRKGLGKAPKETRDYLKRVKGLLGIKTSSLSGANAFKLLAEELNPDLMEVSGKTDLIAKAGKLIAKKGEPIVGMDVVEQARTALKAKGSAEGIDFNLDKMETTEQLDNLIDTISEVYKEPIKKAKRGVQTFDETQAKADMSRKMGFDVEAVISRQPGELWPAHRIKAARDIFVSELEKTDALAHAIKDGNNTSENLIAFRRQLAVVSAVQSQVKGVQTETARALSQYRMTAKSPMETQVNLAEMIQKSGGADTNEAMVDAYLNVLENGGDGAAATFARNAEQVTGFDMLYEAWINSLLGSPKTHAVNMLGNSLTINQAVIERYVAASYGTLERGVLKQAGKESAPGVTFKEANALAQGMAMSTNDAMMAFLKALKTGEGSDIFGKIDYHTDSITTQNINELPISKTIASKMMQGDEMINSNGQLAHMIDFMGEYYYRLPGRMLMAEDEFFKTVNYRGQLHALAAREAGEAGLDKGARQARLEEILTDPQLNAPELHREAFEFAREQTFTTPPGPVAQKLREFLSNAEIGNFPAGRVVVPFFNVINNITKYVGGRVPGLGLIDPNSKTYKDFFSPDPAVRQLQMGKWATGSSLLGFGAYSAMNGICTGRMTDNTRMLSQIEKTQGRKRYSCQLPGSDKTFSYTRLEPAGMLMAIGADTATAMAYIDNDEERQNLALAATAAIVPYMEDKSFFSGISRFFEAFNPQFADDQSRSRALGRYFSDLGSSAPGALLGPLAPNTPLTRNVNQNLMGDRAKRMVEANKWSIETDKYGEEMLVANSESYQIWERTMNKIYAGTPGLSDSLPIDVNIWGQEIHYEGGLGPDMVTPIYTNTPNFKMEDLKGHNFPRAIEAGRFRDMRVGTDLTIEQHKEFVDIVGIDGELERLNMPLNKPRSDISARVNGKVVGLPVKMNPDDRIALINIMNEISPPNDAHPDRERMNLKQTLNWMIKQEEYAMLPDDRDATGAKGDLIRKVYNEYKGAAIELFFANHPTGQSYYRKSINMKQQAQNTGVQ